jgi:hypothetical protein
MEGSPQVKRLLYHSMHPSRPMGTGFFYDRQMLVPFQLSPARFFIQFFLESEQHFRHDGKE